MEAVRAEEREDKEKKDIASVESFVDKGLISREVADQLISKFKE